MTRFVPAEKRTHKDQFCGRSGASCRSIDEEMTTFEVAARSPLLQRSVPTSRVAPHRMAPVRGGGGACVLCVRENAAWVGTDERCRIDREAQ